MKKYAFLILVLLLAAAFIAVSLLAQGEEKYIYSPEINLTKPIDTPSESDAPKIIGRTRLVYFYDDSTVFHIDPECSGMGTIQGRPCGQALDEGKMPCGRCMKDYTIQ